MRRSRRSRPAHSPATSRAISSRFADFVDDIVGFEANRAFASFEDPHIRARSRRLARLNSEFMNACTRLHALHQLVKRLRANGSDAVLDALAPHVDACATLRRCATSGSAASRHRRTARTASLPQRVAESRARAANHRGCGRRPARLRYRDRAAVPLHRRISRLRRHLCIARGRSRVRALGHALRGEDQFVLRRVRVPAHDRRRRRDECVLARI